MLPLYAARIEDLGQGDFVKVDCAACHHVALLAPEFLRRLGLSPQTKVLDLKERVRCRGCGKRGRAVVSIKWRGRGAKRVTIPWACFGLLPDDGRAGAPFGKGAAPGWGKLSTPLPTQSVARPDVNFHAGSNSTRQRSTKCHPQIIASALASRFGFYGCQGPAGAGSHDPPAWGGPAPGSRRIPITDVCGSG
jgi:hypothetical protein